MASSSLNGNVRTDGATDGAIGPLSGLFTDTMETQIPSHDMSNDNDDNDNDKEQSDIVHDMFYQCAGISDYWKIRHRSPERRSEPWRIKGESGYAYSISSETAIQSPYGRIKIAAGLSTIHSDLAQRRTATGPCARLRHD